MYPCNVTPRCCWLFLFDWKNRLVKKIIKNDNNCEVGRASHSCRVRFPPLINPSYVPYVPRCGGTCLCVIFRFHRFLFFLFPRFTWRGMSGGYARNFKCFFFCLFFGRCLRFILSRQRTCHRLRAAPFTSSI